MFNSSKLQSSHLKNKDNTSQSHQDDSRHNPCYALSTAPDTELITEEILAFICSQSTISCKLCISLFYQMLSSCTPEVPQFLWRVCRDSATIWLKFFPAKYMSSLSLNPWWFNIHTLSDHMTHFKRPTMWPGFLALYRLRTLLPLSQCPHFNFKWFAMWWLCAGFFLTSSLCLFVENDTGIFPGLNSKQGKKRWRGNIWHGGRYYGFCLPLTFILMVRNMSNC